MQDRQQKLVMWEVLNVQLGISDIQEGVKIAVLSFEMVHAEQSYACIVSGPEGCTTSDLLGALTTAAYSFAGRIGAEIVASHAAKDPEDASRIIAELEAKIEKDNGSKLN